MKSLSPTTKKNLFTCGLILLAIVFVLWLILKPSSNKSCRRIQTNEESKIIIPIGNGQSVALTKEQYQKLKETYTVVPKKKEGFYVSQQEYIPNVQTENEYTPMLSLYKPKEPTRVLPEPTPMPEVIPGPIMPVPVPGVSPSEMTGATGPVEGYGNVFIDNFNAPSIDPSVDKYRQELTGISPFFLNNGKIMNGETI